MCTYTKKEERKERNEAANSVFFEHTTEDQKKTDRALASGQNLPLLLTYNTLGVELRSPRGMTGQFCLVPNFAFIFMYLHV